MLIDALTFRLEKSGCLDAFWDKLDEEDDASIGVASSARPLLAAARFTHRAQPTLILIAGEEAAQAFARQLSTYLGEGTVLRFPERSDSPFKKKKKDPRTIAKQMEALHALRSQEKVVVASARSLMRLLPPAAAKLDAPLVFESGKELVDIPELSEQGIAEYTDLAPALERMGYQNTGTLDGPGTFALHGGTIDLFPGNEANPVRIDFFGDEIDEIRRIVPSTGQTISSLPRVEAFAVSSLPCDDQSRSRALQRLSKAARTNPALREACEQLEGDLHFDGIEALAPHFFEHMDTIDAYLNRNALSVLLEPRSLIDDMAHFADELEKDAKGSYLPVSSLYASAGALNFGSCQQAIYSSIMQAGNQFDTTLPVKRVEVAGHPEKLFSRLRNLAESGYMTVFCAANYRVRHEMELAFIDEGLSIQSFDRIEKEEEETAPREDEAKWKARRLRRGVVNVVNAEVPLGMIIPNAKLALVSITDTKGASRTHSGKTVDITQITFPYKPGDYVVHAVHGVARFADLVRREVDGSERDYLFLEYAEGDKLFVPVEQFDRVTRYVGADGVEPRLTRLDTADWSRAVNRARKAVKKLAFDLVDIYARRAVAKGHRFAEDTPDQLLMEDSFPYEETPDQLAAIADVKTDMQSDKPMDRLICGDVGFGKTEVAMRAAFKATQDYKQVMVLCPTTILAQQHYTSFSERFEPFNVRVEVLSRFRSAAEQSKALEDFSQGKVDVLIGTHRLLSRDVNPHDLGLVIIDEEQRFGVGHKEQLKNFRESIDVLALSATPIPRTMQMSLSGVRDMSLILTPPRHRRPVEVHVGEWDPDVVSAAIRTELARGGQVYYVSNRVRTIEDAMERVAQAAGEARIGVAHGQMSKTELERTMEDFSSGLIDVLVATTIIESGIDNPHTNTLIIEDSQRLGLAQMYQLKGRVGRASTQAYAYFMFPEQCRLSEEAVSRLTALDEYQELGSGVRIAMKDLEIRGAGSLLGAEQSGNMSAVGFDLFAQMLANAVNATREGNLDAMNTLPAALSDIIVNLPGNAFLPEDYLPDTDERVLIYRRLASAGTQASVQEIEQEVLAHHPAAPPEAKNIFTKARIKAFANEQHIKMISVAGGKLIIEPLDIPSGKLTQLRRYGARYLKDKRKLQLPLRYFKLDENDNLFSRIEQFLHEEIE